MPNTKRHAGKPKEAHMHVKQLSQSGSTDRKVSEHEMRLDRSSSDRTGADERERICVVLVVAVGSNEGRKEEEERHWAPATSTRRFGTKVTSALVASAPGTQAHFLSF